MSEDLPEDLSRCLSGDNLDVCKSVWKLVGISVYMSECVVLEWWKISGYLKTYPDICLKASLNVGRPGGSAIWRSGESSEFPETCRIVIWISGGRPIVIHARRSALVSEGLSIDLAVASSGCLYICLKEIV